MDYKNLLEKAKEASGFTHSPYSEFPVGAALLCKSGKIFTGANVENRSYGLTNCAERSAVFSAVSAGETEFEAIAVYCSAADYPVPPCGACRQVLSEFAGPDFTVIFSGSRGGAVTTTLKELYPYDSLKELSRKPKS